MQGLEIHDGGLLSIRAEEGGAISAEESLPKTSPGFALLEGETLHTGNEAARRARRMPRAAHSRFWQELGLEAAGRPFPPQWSLADLAHAHLEEIWKEQPGPPLPVLLTLSSAFSHQQMGLLLGIFHAAQRPVAALVDTAAAAAAAATLEGPVFYLDPHLHRFTFTAVAVGKEAIGRSTEVLPEIGLERLNELWARRIAEAFVRSTRFDPLHSGATEQLLYDHLPEWLDKARLDGELEASLEAPGREVRATVNRDHLVAAAGPAYDKILEKTDVLLRSHGPASLLISHRAARLPGLAQALESLAPRGLEISPPGAGLRAALELARSVETPAGGVSFRRRLPVLTPGRPAAPRKEEKKESPSDKPGATHLVYRGLAHPIDSSPLWLGEPPDEKARASSVKAIPIEAEGDAPPGLVLQRRAGETVVDTAATFEGRGGWRLNGRRLRGQARLFPGDVLHFETPGAFGSSAAEPFSPRSPFVAHLVSLADPHGPA